MLLRAVGFQNGGSAFTSPSYCKQPLPFVGSLLSSGELPWWLSRHNGRPETALSVRELFAISWRSLPRTIPPSVSNFFLLMLAVYRKRWRSGVAGGSLARLGSSQSSSPRALSPTRSRSTTSPSKSRRISALRQRNSRFWYVRLPETITKLLRASMTLISLCACVVLSRD